MNFETKQGECGKVSYTENTESAESCCVIKVIKSAPFARVDHKIFSVLLNKIQHDMNRKIQQKF